MDLVCEFTKREKDVYDLLLKGLTINQIADELNIARSTVDTHKNSIYQKKFVSTQSKLIAQHYAVKNTKIRSLIKEAEFKLEALPQGYFIEYFEKEFLKKIKEVMDADIRKD